MTRTAVKLCRGLVRELAMRLRGNELCRLSIVAVWEDLTMKELWQFCRSSHSVQRMQHSNVSVRLFSQSQRSSQSAVWEMEDLRLKTFMERMRTIHFSKWNFVGGFCAYGMTGDIFLVSLFAPMMPVPAYMPMCVGATEKSCVKE